jgi:DNA-directed RNA polymerase specialized sigma24 family protein
VEEIAAFNDRRSAMRRALDGMSPQEREILAKFYTNGESEEQICREMGLTEGQYRRLKSRGTSLLQAVMRAKV